MKAWKAAAIACAVLVLGGGGVGAQNVEAIMRARETLALTEDQISQLDAIRREIVAERSAERAEVDELRSQLAAGQIRQSELMAAQEARADAREARRADVQARVDAVLTEEQRASVERLQVRAQRAGGRRPGFGPGGGRAFGPGGRGGFGPGGFGPVGPRGGRRGGGGFGLQ